MRKSRTLYVVVAILLLAYLAWRYLGEGEQSVQAESPDLAVNRVWVDSRPESYSDKVHAFLVVDYAPLGMFQEASSYAGRHEIFEYRRKGGEIDLIFPQDGRKAHLSYQVSACDDLLPFDLCLDVKENPWAGPRRYYSMRDPESDTSLTRLRHELRHHLEGTPRP